MKKNKVSISLLVPALMAIFLSSPLHAEFYAGASIGVTDPGGNGKTSNMIRLHAGYRIIEYLALEIARIDFGKIDSKSSDDGSIELESLEYSVIGSFPFLEKHSVYARVGGHKWDADVSINDDLFGNVQGSIDGRDVLFGLGYANKFSDMGALRIEINRYEIEEGEIDTVSFGLEAHF